MKIKCPKCKEDAELAPDFSLVTSMLGVYFPGPGTYTFDLANYVLSPMEYAGAWSFVTLDPI